MPMAAAASSQPGLQSNLGIESPEAMVTSHDSTMATTAAAASLPDTTSSTTLSIARDRHHRHHHDHHRKDRLRSSHNKSKDEDEDEDEDMMDDDGGMEDDDMAEPFPDVPDHIHHSITDADSHSSAGDGLDTANSSSNLAPTMSSLTLSNDHESAIMTDDDGTHPRRRRRISPAQLAVLRHVYETRTKYPIPALRNELAEKLGLRSRMVQVWFQNQRQQEATRRREIERERSRERMAADVSVVSANQRLAVLHRQRSMPTLTPPGVPHLPHGRSLYQGSLPTSPISSVSPHHALEMVNGPGGTLLLICDGTRSPPPLTRGPDGRIARDPFVLHGPNPPAPPFRPWALDCPAQWTMSEIPIAGRLGGKRRRRVTVSGGTEPILSKPTFMGSTSFMTEGSAADLDGYYSLRAPTFPSNGGGLHNGIMRRRPRRASGPARPVWAEYVTSVSDATALAMNHGSAPGSPSATATFGNDSEHHPYHHHHNHHRHHHHPPPSSPSSSSHPSYASLYLSHRPFNPHIQHPSLYPPPSSMPRSQHLPPLPPPTSLPQHHHPRHPSHPPNARHPAYFEHTTSSPTSTPVEGGRRRSYTTSAMPLSSSLGTRDIFYPVSPHSQSPPVGRPANTHHTAEYPGYTATPASPLRYESTHYQASSSHCTDPHCQTCPPRPSSPPSSSPSLLPPLPPPSEHSGHIGRAYSSSPCHGPCCRPGHNESGEMSGHRYDGVLPPPTTLLPPPAQSPNRMNTFLSSRSSPPPPSSSSMSYAPNRLPSLPSAATLLNDAPTHSGRLESSETSMDVHMHSSESCTCCDHKSRPPPASWRPIQAE